MSQEYQYKIRVHKSHNENVHSLLFGTEAASTIQLVVASVKGVVAKPTWALPVSKTL